MAILSFKVSVFFKYFNYNVAEIYLNIEWNRGSNVFLFRCLAIWSVPFINWTIIFLPSWLLCNILNLHDYWKAKLILPDFYNCDWMQLDFCIQIFTLSCHVTLQCTGVDRVYWYFPHPIDGPGHVTCFEQ